MMPWRKDFVSVVFVCYFLLLCVCLSYSKILHNDYCVIGAGPAGLQMGYFLKKAQRDYIIFERSNIAGSFFLKYPRHRKLISINKRHTGKTNKEFNLRHDWNSLLSDDESLLFGHYSKLYFPQADSLLEYLTDFQTKLNINVQFNTTIENIREISNSMDFKSHVLHMNDQNGHRFSCGTLIVATGMWKPNIPEFEGAELAVGYENASVNQSDYDNKSVLILGKGNSAFEIADSIYGCAKNVHLLSRSRMRLAWSTHYIGDVRALNNAILDNYQLKSLDGILEGPLEYLAFVVENGKIYTKVPYFSDNFSLRLHYDILIRCLGFKFDWDIFHNDTERSPFKRRRLRKYPKIKDNYESVDLPGLFYAGAIAHSLDFRKAAGGFIHGFRYTVRALHRILEWRNHQILWPSVKLPISDLLSDLLKRINEASGLYQMFGVLGDIYLFKSGSSEFEHIQEFPVKNLHHLKELAGRGGGSSLVVLLMQYGTNYSGPGKDVFDYFRATSYAERANASNFLHPVLYYYKSIPTEFEMLLKLKDETLPLPNQLHHIVEDFLAEWNAPFSHTRPLRRFLENSLGMDLRNFFNDSCMKFWMIYSTVPITCEQHFLRGQ